MGNPKEVRDEEHVKFSLGRRSLQGLIIEMRLKQKVLTQTFMLQSKRTTTNEVQAITLWKAK